MMVAAGPAWPQLQQLLAPHPAIQDWMGAVRQAVGAAVYDDAHSKLRAAVKRLAASSTATSGGGDSGGGRPKL